MLVMDTLDNAHNYQDLAAFSRASLSVTAAHRSVRPLPSYASCTHVGCMPACCLSRAYLATLLLLLATGAQKESFRLTCLTERISALPFRQNHSSMHKKHVLDNTSQQLSSCAVYCQEIDLDLLMLSTTN